MRVHTVECEHESLVVAFVLAESRKRLRVGTVVNGVPGSHSPKKCKYITVGYRFSDARSYKAFMGFGQWHRRSQV